MKKIKNSEVTPEKIYKKRRDFVKKLGLSAGSMFIGQKLINPAFASNDNLENKITEYRYISTYNNYYEFGTKKMILSKNLKTLKQNLGI